MPQLHALIIDDNIRNVNVLGNLLSYENISHASITNPLQLETLLDDSGEFHLVFLDLEMPGLTGYDVLTKLKQDQRFAGIPIVACTVNTSEIRAARQKGFNGFIGKPLDPDKFPQQLARILNGEPVWDAN